MAITYTENYNLKKQEDKSDDFSMDVITENMDALDGIIHDLSERFGGLNYVKISQTAFDALAEKDENTVYYVYDSSGGISQYIGGSVLSFGSGVHVSSGVSTLSTGTSIIAHAEEAEE